MGRIVTIIGTRPEIIKMAPVVKAIDELPHEHILVHSGQHYDLMMDRVFFRDMKLREPDVQLELKEQLPHLQVARTVMQAASVASKADLVIVHGDTNTTLAGALLGNKLGKPVAHVEAGIRSFDRTMPEEVNRIITDQVSRVLLTAKAAEQFGLSSLLKVPGRKVIPPTGYLDMLELERNASLVFTDSGGLQEEACFFHVPCVTLRENTERPETLDIGANVLAGTDPRRILEAADKQKDARREWPNPFGDGTTGRQIAQIVA